MATRPCPPPQSRWTSPGWSTSPTSSSSSPPPAMLSFTQPRLYETKTLDLEADMCFQCFNVPYIQQKKENCWRPHQWWYLWSPTQDVRFRNLLVTDLKRLLLLYRNNADRSYLHISDQVHLTAPSCIKIFSWKEICFQIDFLAKHSPLFAFVLSRIPSTEEPLSLTSMSASSVSNTRINNYPKTYRSSTILWPPCFLFIPTFKSSPTKRWSGTRASPLDNRPTSQRLDWSQFLPPNAKS